MSVSRKIHNILKKSGVKYETISHSQTFTSQETARTEHVSGNEMAKVVMAKIDGEDTMLVMPASRKLDLLKLSACFGTQNVRLMEEKEFSPLFPGCETGAIPPLGWPFSITCYVDKSLLAGKEIVFNAGTHTESIKMATKDYEKLAQVETGDFSVIDRGKN